MRRPARYERTRSRTYNAGLSKGSGDPHGDLDREELTPAK
jgi:hypothetical protein